VDALVWVEGWHLQAEGELFAVGQVVTWPISANLNQAALAETVGPVTAATVSMIVDWDPWHPTHPYETVEHTGVVEWIELYRHRTAGGRVVPGSVPTLLVAEATGWGPEDDGLRTAGYLVSLTDFERVAAT
jgi:hypothetical protein